MYLSRINEMAAAAMRYYIAWKLDEILLEYTGLNA